MYNENDKAKEKLSSVGKALSAFWPSWDTGSCVGGWENSVTLRAPGVFRLGLEVLTGTRLVEVMRVDA